MANLAIPLQNISFVEKNYLKKLGQLGIETVRDFLYYFPHRYYDFSVIT
jgi:RecG-like helicase